MTITFKINKTLAWVILIIVILLASILIKSTKKHNYNIIKQKYNTNVISDLKNNANIVLYEKKSDGTIIASKYIGDKSLLKHTIKKSSQNLVYVFDEGFNAVIYIDYKIKDVINSSKSITFSKSEYIPVYNNTIELEIDKKNYYITLNDLFK